ncbi:MAG: hypothetical protein HY533_01560 [Chloroflexi bacterium]|nr:hypothetical protein [Chloroflexota bacterium]
MLMKVLDHHLLLALNERSVSVGRRQNLKSWQIPTEPQERYWVNMHEYRQKGDSPEVRVCVVLSLVTCETAWLDLSPDEFAAIPERDVHLMDWETAMCAGTPEPAP